MKKGLLQSLAVLAFLLSFGVACSDDSAPVHEAETTKETSGEAASKDEAQVQDFKVAYYRVVFHNVDDPNRLLQLRRALAWGFPVKPVLDLDKPPEDERDERARVAELQWRRWLYETHHCRFWEGDVTIEMETLPVGIGFPDPALWEEAEMGVYVAARGDWGRKFERLFVSFDEYERADERDDGEEWEEDSLFAEPYSVLQSVLVFSTDDEMELIPAMSILDDSDTLNLFMQDRRQLFYALYLRDDVVFNPDEIVNLLPPLPETLTEGAWERLNVPEHGAVAEFYIASLDPERTLRNILRTAGFPEPTSTLSPQPSNQPSQPTFDKTFELTFESTPSSNPTKEN